MNLKEVNEALSLYIRPHTFPLAVKMCQSSDELPSKARIPSLNMGTSISICQGISMARRYGWTVAIGKDDESCPHGLFVLGFVLKGYLDGSCGELAGFGSKESLATSAQRLSKLEYGKYSHLLVAPLHTATFEPQLIIVYGNAAQVARLVQGIVATEGNEVTTPLEGSIACSSIIARTIVTDECQVVVAGAGERYFALTQDDELTFTMPLSKVEPTIQGLEKGHKSGFHRYPTPSAFKLEGVLPPIYYQWAELLKKAEEDD